MAWRIRRPAIVAAGPALLLWTGWIVYRNYLKVSAPYGHFVSIFWRLLSVSGPILAQGLARNAAIVASFWLLAVQTGRPILSSLLRADCATRLEEFLFAGGIGSGLISLLLLGLGLCGGWAPGLLSRLFWAAAALSLLRAIIEYRGRGRAAPPGKPALMRGEARWTAVELAALALMLGAAAITLLGTAAPELFYDSLLYHLGLPKLYLTNHRIFPTPYNAYSGAPQAMQMLYGLMLSMGDERLTALLNWSFAALTALALWGLPPRESPRRAGTMAALLFFLAPVTLYAASCSGADLGASFYCALSFFALLRMSDPKTPSWSICAGMLLGLAMGTEYNVFPVAALLALAAFALGGAQRASKGVRVAGTALCFAAPWLLKNIAFFGTPLYPVFHFLQKPGLGPTDLPGLLTVAAPRDLAGFLTLDGWKEFLRFPWSVCENPMSMDNWPGPALFMLLPWIVLSRWEGAPLTAGLYALAAYLGWSVPNTVGRFVLPALAPLAYAAGLAVNGDGPRWPRRVAWLGVLIVCWFNFQAECHQGVVSQRWTFLAQRRSKADFLNEEHLTYPLPSYSALSFMNRALGPGSKVLFVGDARGFYCDRNFIAPAVYNANPLWTSAARALSAEDIRRALAAEGITHIFLNAKGLGWASSPKLLPKAAIRSRVFEDFWSRYLDLLFQDNDPGSANSRWLFVYSLRERPKEIRDPNFLNPPRLVLQALERSGPAPP